MENVAFENQLTGCTVKKYRKTYIDIDVGDNCSQVSINQSINVYFI